MSSSAGLNPSIVTGTPDSPVAVCTLSGHDLLRRIAASPLMPRVAAVGPLETENVGIERMVLTLLQRPRIRWLVVCGHEARGRYQGQALVSLFEHGVEEDGRIAQAQSRRARVPSLSPSLVDVARRQVRLVDLRGVADLHAIARAVEEGIAADPGSFDEPVDLPTLQAIEVGSKPFRLKEHDPVGFFVVAVDREEERLVVDHYGTDGVLRHRLVGQDAESLCTALLEWDMVTRMEHAAYLGRELAKAEAALRFDLEYEQDEGLRRASGVLESGG